MVAAANALMFALGQEAAARAVNRLHTYWRWPTRRRIVPAKTQETDGLHVGTSDRVRVRVADL